jgi:protein-S-isoprenylcysteine O-methyltransferase Ste14
VSDPSRDNPGVIAFPPALFVGTLLAGLLLQWLFPRHLFPYVPARVAGSILALGGLVIANWGRRTMESAGTNVKPSEPTLAIVSEGPFRFSRNPLYLSLAAVYLGITLLFNALWPLVLFLPLMIVAHFGIVLREERYLEKKFGETYLAYKRRVRRWI